MVLLNLYGVAVGVRQCFFTRHENPSCCTSESTSITGIDQHHRQLSISLCDGEGNVILKRQISTRPEKTRTFLDDVRRRSAAAADEDNSPTGDRDVAMISP